MRRALSVLVGIVILLISPLLAAVHADALTIASNRDCDSNAVINCGALDLNELENRSSQSGVAQIYSSFGISMQDINNMRNTAVEGVVTNKNNVWIHRSSGLCPNTDNSSLSTSNQQAVQNNPNLCLVATNAMTAGRQNISGSVTTTSGEVTFFKRPPSVSFASSSLPAFVVMDSNHQFSFAIIASCGNPVTATPVSVMATPKPASQIKTSTTTSPAASATATATVNVTTPSVQAATTTTTTQPAAATKTLPNTGPGNILMLSGATSAIGAVGHLYYSRRNRK